MEEYLLEKLLTPWEAQIVLGGGDILLIKIKIKCPVGQNLEIMTFRYLNPTKRGGGGWRRVGPMDPPLLIYLSSHENHFIPALMLSDF